MIQFPNATLHRYSLFENGRGVYGETVTEYVYVDDITVDFQNENNVEIAKDYGVELQNLYKIYVDLNTPLLDTDQLRDDKGRTYHILGNIKEYDHFHHYKKAHLARER